jgi:hypothetical protein
VADLDEVRSHLGPVPWISGMLVHARIPFVGMLDGTKDQLLAEGIGWREAGRLDEARERMLGLSHEFPDDGLIAFQTAWIHDRLGLERDAVRTISKHCQAVS